MSAMTAATRRRAATAGVTLTALLAVTACGSSMSTDRATGATPAPTAMAVTLTDTGCQPATFEIPAGPTVVTITNSSSSRSEFEIRTAKPSIVGESEGIASGSTAELDLTLDDGSYDLVCGTGEVFEGALVVGTGVGGGDTATTIAGAADLAAAVAAYTTWVNGQLDTLVADTQHLSDAVASGDLEQARSAYGTSRLAYERLEPIAELFPDLDGAMDAREDDFPAGVDDPTFTGWHRIEHLLYGKGDLAAAARFAVDLAENAVKLKTQINSISIDPGTMVNGAAGLIEEAAATKITGEEDRYSQLSLVDLAANVEGAEQIVDLLSTELQEADPALLAAIQKDFTGFDTELAAYEKGGGYQPYDQLTAADRNKLKAALATLSEDLAQMPGALQIEVG